MNVHLSKIALGSCLMLLLTACNQIGAPTPANETPLSPVVTMSSADEQMELEPEPPIQATPESTTMIMTTKPQQQTVTSTSPTKAITEISTNEAQMQPALDDKSTENVKLAKQDLAQRLGVSVDSITVVAVVGQEFSADAFYCRASKEQIAREESPQVMSGLSIVLSTSGRRYEYHASDQEVTFCQPLP